MTDSPSEDRLVQIERRDDGVAVLHLANGKMNTLSQEALRALADAVADLVADPPGAVVVTGGDRLLAAGAEINDFLADPGSSPSPVADAADVAAYGRQFLEAFNALAALPRATIAVVNGYALGGGCELALACDFRVAGERAKLGQPEILLGIIPGGGGTQRLARLVGPARAKDLILTGRQVDAAEALAMGLVDRVVPDADAHDEALNWATELAQGPQRAHALAKQAIDDGLDGSLAEGLELEQELFVEVFATTDAEAGINSFLADGPGKAVFGDG